VKVKAENTQLAAAKDDSDKQLADATSKISDLNTQLTTAQQQAKDAATALQTANDAAKTAKDALDAINQKLNGETPDQYIADKQKAESDLAAAQAEQKILQDSLQSTQQQVADLTDAINRSKTGQMPGVSGKITFVDHAWNFVILNVGLSNGVVPNGELIVYRGRTFLGKVRVTKVDPNDAVAEILPDIKGDIQIGDSVLN
jgi:cell shape-determining protein MreC